MDERPKCQGKDCTEWAVIMVRTKFVCANCLFKFQEKERAREEAILEEI